MLELTVNGKAVVIEKPMRIAEFLQIRGLHQKMVVVELNREIVPRDRYDKVMLNAGDEIEIVQMMAGG